MITANTIRKAYGETLAIDDFSLAIQKGEFVSLVGPSGCGKSTLLKLIGGLIQPGQGKIQREGTVSFMFQKPVLLPWRSVLSNVQLSRESSMQDTSQQLLDLVGLSSFSKHYPHQLSGGMQQRVALARALHTQAPVLLMDEPFGAIDELTRETLQQELKKLHKQLGLTIIFVTHSISEAVFLSDRIIVLSDRPARIKEIIPVKLGDQRNKESLVFQEHVRCIRKALL